MPIKIPEGAEKGKKAFQEKESNSKSLASKGTSMGPKSGQHSKTIDLASKSTLMGPNTGWDRILMGRLANVNAIPDISPSPPGSPSSNPSTTPATTSAVEILTQAGDVLTTQAGIDLVTQ